MANMDNSEISQIRLGGGSTSDVFLLGNDRVLKVYNQSHYKKAEIEYKKTLLAGELGIPVPKMYSLTTTQNGNPAIEMERVPGMILNDYLSKHPERYPFILYDMARLSVRMNRLNYTFSEDDAAFAQEYLDIKHYVCSRICQISRLSCVSSEEVGRMQRFYESIPESRGFLHGDLDPSNIMISEDGNHLLPIDYGDSGYGSWLFELLRMYTIHYDPKHGSYGRLRLLIKRQLFRYYLWAFLRIEHTGIKAATVLQILGAMTNIERLVAYSSSSSEFRNDEIRRCADRALKCIDSLPHGIFPPDRKRKGRDES